MTKIKSLEKYLGNCIPRDHSRQVISTYFLEQNGVCGKLNRVLDLGCGKGDSIDIFERINPSVDWVGLDVSYSPEVEERTRKDSRFYSFDGVNIPFEEDCFDVVYCNQVFEHVSYPRELLREVYRVLKRGGYFVGSFSQLEPYHSLSICNYTPYGFKLLLNEAGFELREFRPGIDCITLIARRLFKRHRLFNRFFKKESPINILFSFVGKLLNKSNYEINTIKLMFCGHLCFYATKNK